MMYRFIITAVVFLSSLFACSIIAQTNQADTIENVQAKIQNDSLVISFNINTTKNIESVWVEVSTNSKGINSIDRRKIIDQLAERKRWKNVKTSAGNKIIWAYPEIGNDLAGQDISIDVKAKVYSPAEKFVEIPKYPLFRPGIEIMTTLNNSGNYGASATLTFEYIAKPYWSIFSGIGYQSSEVEYSNIHNYGDLNTYESIIVPLTVEYKLNAGRWFRLYAGGGIQNRFVINEDDAYLNLGQGLNRYVLGVKAGAGIEIRNVRLGATYASDITSYSAFNEKISYLGLTLGWRFGGSKAYIK